MSELEKLRLELKDFTQASENATDIPDQTFRVIVESVPNGIVMSDDKGQIICLKIKVLMGI